jgi:cobalamin biosynthesis protein CobW
VGDRLHQYFDRAWRPGEDRIGRLVIIGEQGLEQPAIAAAIAAGAAAAA